MQTRTQSKEVIFARAFILDGMDALQPAGAYRVDTDEEMLETLSGVAWRRVRTVLRIERSGRVEYLPVDPDCLDKALSRDAAQHNPPGSRPEDGTKGRRDRARNLGLWPSKLRWQAALSQRKEPKP